MAKPTSSEINALDQAIENLTHDLRYEHRAVEIIRAVNSHAALVAACMALRSAYDKGAGSQEIESNSVDWSDVDMAHELACEALDNLAKGA